MERNPATLLDKQAKVKKFFVETVNIIYAYEVSDHFLPCRNVQNKDRNKLYFKTLLVVN